jgi:hypothetical protein
MFPSDSPSHFPKNYSFAQFKRDFSSGDTVRDNLVVTLSSVVFFILGLTIDDWRLPAQCGAAAVTLVLFCVARTLLQSYGREGDAVGCTCCPQYELRPMEDEVRNAMYG